MKTMKRCSTRQLGRRIIVASKIFILALLQGTKHGSLYLILLVETTLF